MADARTTADGARYEARPTRMFGAYTLWAIDAQGAERQVAHGDPRWCIDEARRRNGELGYRASAAHDAFPQPAGPGRDASDPSDPSKF